MLDFSQDFDPFALAQAAARQRQSQAQNMTDEQTGTFLGDKLERALGGLAYVGKVADKTFGGRAVRGLLGGRPEEALSLLPFSDTLGLTDEKNTVSGNDLNAHLGLTTPGDDSWENLAAGFGTELLTDPSTYLGIGALTKGGQAASKLGMLPRGFRRGIQGLDVAESSITPTLKSAERAIDSPLLAGGKTLLPQALEDAGVKTGEPLKALFGVGLPFRPPVATFGTGETAQKVAGLVDTIGSGIAGLAPVRALRAALDPEVGGAYVRGGQQLSQEFYRPLLKEGRRAAGDEALGFAQQVDDLIAKNPAIAGQTIRMAAEYDPASQLVVGKNLLERAIDRASPHFDPAETQRLIDVGQAAGAADRRYGPLAQEGGYNMPLLDDPSVAHHTRSKNQLPRQGGESIPSFLGRRAEDLSTGNPSAIQREKLFTGVPGGTVQVDDWAKNASLRGMTPAERQAYFLEELTGTRTPSPDKAVNDQAKGLADWVAKLPEAHSKEQIGFYNQDPFADLRLGAERYAKTHAAGETVFEGVKRFARPSADFVAANTDHVMVSDILKQLRLNYVDPSQPGSRVADLILRNRLGLGNADDVKRLALPRDIANDVLKLGQAWDTPKQVAPLLAGWDFLNNAFKTWVTTPFPAFHTRNLISGMFNQWRDNAFSVGGMHDTMEIMRGNKLLEKPYAWMKPGGGPQEWTNELFAKAAARDVAFTRSSGHGADTLLGGDSLMQRAPMAGNPTGRSLLGEAKDVAAGLIPERGKIREQLNPLNVQGVGSDRDLNVVAKTGRRVQKTLDDWVQMSHFKAKLDQGFSPDAAADAVKKYHNNYTDLTSLEKNVLKRVIPWYSFSRRSLPPILEDLATQPAKIAGAVRLASGVREPFDFVPGFVAEGASVPIPGAPEGQKRYISSFGLPIEDEALKVLASIGQGNATRALQQTFGMTNPLIKAPAEMVFGTQLYSGRKLEDLKPFNAVTAPGLLSDENARLVSQLLANTPASRFFTTADKFLDERKGTLPTLLNTLTGVRVSDVDESRQRDIELRKLLENSLAGKPEVKTSTRLFIPKDKLGLLDPEQVQIYEAYQAASKRIAERSKLQAAAMGRQ